ncbi:V-type ATP synthase subunit I [Streptobacillus moniliformis]|uniref:V-type ATP synthase subunit I n=1 Tax=Streptobacillus moniliformis TaxID=34105 RepID=UPI0007E460EC|nr:V-type ATP synthase subunit I [Streptobacillus moniliformis]
MAIVKVEKFNLISFKNELNALLKQLQEFVEVDFRELDLELDNLKSNNKDELEEKIYKLESIIKKIRKYSIKKPLIKSLKEGKKDFSYQELEKYISNIDIDNIVEEINQIFYQKESKIKANEVLLNEIKEYEKWSNLDVTQNDLAKLKNVDVNIGSMSVKNFEKFKLEELILSELEIIDYGKKEVNFIIFSDKNENISEKLRLYNFNKLNLDINKLPSEIKDEKIEKLNNNKLLIENLDKKLNENGIHLEKIEIAYEYYKTILLKENVKEMFKFTDKLSAISGYIPTERKEEFEKRIEKVCDKDYYLTYEEFDENSRDIPIKLENNEILEPFETLTATYSLPKYKEIDPTILVAPFFWLFFGMMIADFGYGIVMSILSGISLLLFKLDKNGKLAAKFLFMLGLSTIFWGLIYGSLFGYEFDNPLHFYSPTVNYKPVMVLSIILGIVHIFIALGVKAFLLIRDKKYYDALCDVGFWIVTLISTGYFIYAKFTGIEGNVVNIAKYSMIISMLLIVATGGREVKNIGGRIGLGAYALYGISGYMGDLISYVRLMALGLSGGYIAYAVNMIASMLGNKWYMLIFVGLILLIGHGFNLFLSMLGAYVHTSRLIYVEFFSKFYEGGGKPFKDFKIKEKYINIRNN